jgi:hypothetical protein
LTRTAADAKRKNNPAVSFFASPGWYSSSMFASKTNEMARTAIGPPPYGRANAQAASRQSDIQPMLISGERKSLPRKRTPAEWTSSEFCG